MKQFSLVLSLLLITNSCSSEPATTESPQPEIQQYSLTINPSTGGTVNNPGSRFDDGSNITLTATPNSEYIFSSWSNGSTDNPLTIAITSDLTISATFTKRQYQLQIHTEGQGTVSETIVTSGKSPTNYTSGTIVELSANPAAGWNFLRWSGSVSSTTNPLELTIDEIKTVTVTFQEVDDTSETASETSTTTNPKEETDGYTEIREYCDTDYRPQSHFEGDSPFACVGNEVSPHRVLQGQLGVANDHSLGSNEQVFIDEYVVALDLIRPAERFYRSIENLMIVIEDNTAFGSFSTAGVCGVSMHNVGGGGGTTFSGILIHELGHSWHAFLNYCHNETIDDLYAVQLEKWNNGTSPWGEGGDNRPYQLYNSGEYVACSIAAYFRGNDGYGTIQDLQTEDPDMYNLINILAN